MFDDSFLTDLVVWVTQQPVYLIYITVTFIAFFENVFPPIPGDVIVVFAGYMIAEGTLDFTTSLILFTIASIIGFMIMYAIGYKLGDGIKTTDRTWLKYFDGEYLDRSLSWMNRYGVAVVLANRFLAGTRSIISISSGMAKLNIWKTVLASGLSALLWNIILLWLGWLVQSNWRLIGGYLKDYGTITVILVIIFLGIKWLNSRNKAPREGMND